jgi:hypothetical protein
VAAASSLIPRSLHAVMHFAHLKADLASVRMKRTKFIWPSSSVCVSQDLRTMIIDAVLSVGSPI